MTERIFEIRAGDQQTDILLNTINQVNGQLDVARSIRRYKAHLFSATENDMIDCTFNSTERVLNTIAELVEPCRVAMKSANDHTGWGTRLLFVLRDSPRIQISMQQLTLAGQNLSTVTLLLFSRPSSDTSIANPTALIAPRSYAESTFLTERRARNLLRRANNEVVQQQARNFDALQYERRIGQSGPDIKIQPPSKHEKHSSNVSETDIDHTASVVTCNSSANILHIDSDFSYASRATGRERSAQSPTRSVADQFEELSLRRSDFLIPNYGVQDTQGFGTTTYRPKSRSMNDLSESSDIALLDDDLKMEPTATSPTAFFFETQDSEPKPLLNKIVKLDISQHAPATLSQASGHHEKSSHTATNQIVAIESEFPEVVPGTVPILIPLGTIRQARDRRFDEARKRHSAFAPEVVGPLRGAEYAPEPVDLSESTVLRSLALAQDVSGRARSQRWREAQLARSLKLEQS